VFSEVRERKVARYGFSAPGKPFRRHSGIPFRTAGRKPSSTTSPLLTSRAPSGHTEESPPITRIGCTLAGFRPYSASGIADSVNAGLPHPPPSALSVSHALDGLHPAMPVRACFIPVTLMGFHLQGFDPFRGAAPLSRSLLSCPWHPSHRPLNHNDVHGAPEPCSPRRVRTAADRNPAAADALLVFRPLRFSPRPRWNRSPGSSSHALRR